MCESQHSRDCTPPVHKLPKRLIDVGSASSTIKLVLGQDLPMGDSRYATLSHCWGSKLPIRTLHENVTTFSNRIPLQQMPKSFSEAVAITQGLGIQYLWIDALCIVQDSVEEWEVEALRMKDVYAGGVLNIAASDASSADEGCFRNCADRGEEKAVTFEFGDESGIARLAVKISTGDFRQATKRRMLSTRGWVLQEQLLSSRVVSCMYPELHWECKRIYQTEGGAQHHKSAPSYFGTPRLFWRSSVDSSQWMWWSWMQDFSSRNFTFWKDRLPALAGITQHYATLFGDAPVLGLWQAQLIGDLLWVRLGKHRTLSDEDLHIGSLPSWSWLSCPAEIMFDFWQISSSTSQRYIVNEDHSALIDFQLEWSGPQLTSMISSALLVLEGPAVEASIQPLQNGRPANPPRLLLTAKAQGSNAVQCVGQFDAKDPIPAIYTCLLLRSRSHSETGARRSMFLILESVKDDTNLHLYRRVGLGCLSEQFSPLDDAAPRRLTLS